ncbi:hypothetical protein Tco_1530795 [Tanacetum coccineum]
MLLNVDQLQKQLDKDDFSRRWIHEAFWVVKQSVPKFIDSRIHYSNDTWTQESRLIEGKELDADLVDTEALGQRLKQCKIATNRQGMIQMLMMQISGPIYD